MSRTLADLDFGTVLEALLAAPDHHAPQGAFHQTMGVLAHELAEHYYGAAGAGVASFGDLGEVRLPYRQMGAISSVNLFGVDELIMFDLYRTRRGVYRRVADLGANIGLHSIVLSRCGYEVRSYEPDPQHAAVLRANLAMNACTADVVEAAVSTRSDPVEFVRILGNTTGSHITGSKPNPYGDLERFMVPAIDARDVFAWADFVKMDVEGHEATIVQHTTRTDWAGTDAVMEVGTRENAEAIYRHLSSLGVSMYPQRLGWLRAESASDLPAGWRDGSLFVSAERLPWA
ncbi:MAG: FkbM family methyltransferase [Dehalococcoidia bacterium]|nr:MAG: FkbM family methyltransferase [Dehalococcoidia bacterium]